jgi:23S rRNA G2445 N2-methylase RlmL
MQVDVVCTDLPFGRRLGSESDNRRLYPVVLDEIARVTRRQHGRCVLLTHDTRTLHVILAQRVGVHGYWLQRSMHRINLGGLFVGVYLLTRNHVAYKVQQ